MKNLLLFTIVFIPLLLTANPGTEKKLEHLKEEFDPSYVERFQHIDDIIAHTDSIYSVENRHTLAYSEEIVKVLRKRFYHGYSHYSFADNWIAAAAGYLFWDHLSALVIPSDILKHPNAACSQQAIVFMACLKKVGVPYRSVLFSGHYALEAKIGDKWFFFDSNIEPELSGNRTSIDNLLKTNKVFDVYKSKRQPEEIRAFINNIQYGKINAAPAPNAAFFHKGTYALSLLTIGLIGTFAIVIFIKRLKSNVLINKLTKRP